MLGICSADEGDGGAHVLTLFSGYAGMVGANSISNNADSIGVVGKFAKNEKSCRTWFRECLFALQALQDLHCTFGIVEL